MDTYFVIQKHTFEGDKDYYFCHGNQQCPKAYIFYDIVTQLKALFG
jgi:hypothetical protein